MSRGRDDGGEPGAILGWARTVRARLLAAGGEILATVSGTVVAAFEPADLGDVLELALDLVADAEREGMAAAVGVALGLLREGAGRAVEVAEALAGRAQGGEVVLDPEARERAGGLFLFGRQVSTGVGGPRGAVIDRAHPIGGLGDAIERLAPSPIAPITALRVPELLAALESGRAPVIVLRGPVGAGAVELVAEAAARARPRFVLVVGGSSGGIVPLASLRYALACAFGDDEAVVSACGDDEEGRGAGRVLRSLLRGGLPPREPLASALAVLLARAGEGSSEARAWAFLTPLAMVDAASLEVLLDVHQRGSALALIARFPVDAELPSDLGERVTELVLPALRTSDARAIAEAVLGPATDAEVARRIAILGGETPLGVVEVARALIAAGDLVLEGERFVWRSAPRGGASAIPLEEVVDERLSRLDDEPRRVLEAVCVAPDGASRELIDAVAGRDGVGEKARVRALERLVREGWIGARSSWRGLRSDAGPLSRPAPSSAFLRRFVVTGMPPARAAELHRFVADALLERGADDPAAPALRAELAHYEIEGGLEDRGAARLADVGRAALETGYRRVASRIAARLAQLGDVATSDLLSRAAATVPPPSDWEDESVAPPSAEVSLDDFEPTGVHEVHDVRDTEPPPPGDDGSRTGASEGPPSSFALAAEEAVRSNDLAALEQLLQRAVASGSDMAAVARFRAIADMLRGDLGAARAALAKARGYRGAHDTSDPRQALAEAAVTLRGGDARGALRLALRALSLARRAGDRRGEIAAQRTIGACLRVLGRVEDADRLEALAVEA